MAVIKWRVQELARQKGIDSAPQLAKAAGIAPGTATGLWYGRQMRVDMPTLERICNLLECDPGDVLVREEVDEGNQIASLVA